MDIPPPPGVTVSPNAWAILVDAQKRPGDIDLFWEFIAAGQLNKLWRAHRDYILAEWVAQRPGTRPDRWWRIEMHGAQRRRLGGDEYTGLTYWCGAPPPPWGGWLESWFASEKAEYESQAAYLYRNNLLSSGELERLTPTDFAPVFVPMVPDC